MAISFLGSCSHGVNGDKLTAMVWVFICLIERIQQELDKSYTISIEHLLAP